MKRYIKDGVIKTRNQIVIVDGNMQIFNPTEEMIFADGWEEYVPPIVEPKKSRTQVLNEIVLEQYNARTDISDAEALDRAIVIYDWTTYIGKTLNAGQCVVHEDKVYRVRQTHGVLEAYPPSLDTAALYEVIVLTATGGVDDPITYTPPMEIFEGKYYVQDGIKYLCTRNSGTALSHNLSDLVGIYCDII